MILFVIRDCLIRVVCAAVGTGGARATLPGKGSVKAPVRFDCAALVHGGGGSIGVNLHQRI